VKYARGNILLLLNPDTEVRGRAIERLRDCLFKLPDTGVIGCRLNNTDGTLQTTCVQPFPTIINQVLNFQVFQRWFPNTRLWLTAATFEELTSPSPVEVIAGACMMIRRDVFNSVEGFSTDYFMYAEDVDLCYKIHAAGFINYYIPEVEIVHHGGGSTKRKHSRFSTVMMRESVFRLLRKTRGDSYSFCYRMALMGGAIVRLALLGLYFPIALIMSSMLTWSIAFDKSIAIIRWSLGLERWVYKYDQAEVNIADLNSATKNCYVESSEN
jgi:GT2 family glycosyltransferase